MPAIPFPASSAPGRRPQESGGRLINAYAKKAPPGAANPVIWPRSPGLRQLVDASAHTHCRGLHLSGSTLLAVLDNRVYSVTVSDSTYTATNLGALSGSGLVTIAENNAATPNIACVAGSSAFNLFTGSGPTSFADADVGSPNSVTVLNGYLTFTYGDGTIRATDLNSVAIGTSSFTRTQAKGGLLRGVSFRKELFVFGPTFFEVYRDVAASPFPFEFVIQTPRGIVGTHAITGYEPGWSNELCWVSDDNVVYRLNGYGAEPISNEDVSRDIETSTDKTLIQCSVAMAGDHAFLIVKSPDDWTWIRDMTTGEWHERQSYGQDDWRASCAVKAFGKWVMGDDVTGKLASFEEGYYREYDNPLIWTLESGIPSTFPSRANIPRVDFQFTAGTGISAGEDPIQTEPKVSIGWSKDGGATWGNPVLRELGPEGSYKNHPFVTRVGQVTGHGVRYRLAVADPVHVGFMGGAHAVQALAE